MSVASLGISYNEYVTKYLGKRDGQGMWWNNYTIAEATGTNEDVIARYRIRVLDKAWAYYQENGNQPSTEELLEVESGGRLKAMVSSALNPFWATFFWNQAITTIAAVLEFAVKDAGLKAKIKTGALKIRDAINLLFPESLEVKKSKKK